MKAENQTVNPQFYFQPFTIIPEMKWLFWGASLILSLLSLLGKASVAFIIYIVNSLHTPMHFFLVLIVPFTLICMSYVFITVPILRIPSALGRKRAFSTCSSHIMVVLMQYSCSGLIYLCPVSCLSAEQVRVVSVFYSFVTPVLNPLIYSMRSKELKEAMNRSLRRIMLPQKKSGNFVNKGEKTHQL